MARLLLAGDVMLGRHVNLLLQKRPPESVWGDLLPRFHDADIRIVNLECVLADRGERWARPPKAFYFRSDTKNVACLERAGIDAVSIANNHVLDYGYGALEDMLVTLDRAGVARAGAGPNREDAAEVAVLERGGVRWGLLAFTDNEPAWAARPDRAGVYHVDVDEGLGAARDLLDRVARARERVDYLVVSAHWGSNWGHEPPAAHVRLGRALIEYGAAVVFGHSAHVFRAVEPWLGGVILYSAGDFVDDYAVDRFERNDWSLLFEIELDNGRVRGMRLTPTVIRDDAAWCAPPGEARKIARRMERLCRSRGVRPEWNGEAARLELAAT